MSQARRKIGILETGLPPKALMDGWGTYAGMFTELLDPKGDRYSVSTFDVAHGELPAAPGDFDAYIVTGSPAGVYDDLPWIAPLEAFLREAKGQARLIGVCFGHQVMAQAFGGRVEKSDKGWGVGLHAYEVKALEPWMDGPAPIAIAVSHQDQVVQLPPNAHVIAGSAFSPNGALAYEDQPAISFQCHPEFAPEFAKALLEQRPERYGPGQAEAAKASLEAPNDRARLAGWMQRFIDAG